MKNTFKITTVDGKTYIKESPQRVLDIYDRRQVKRSDYKSGPEYQMITHDIHCSFFEQLTLQISPQIFTSLKRELPSSYHISCIDRILIHEDHLFYMFTALHEQEFMLHPWVKFYADLPSPDLSKENQWQFELCNEEESKQCDILRFGREVDDVFWVTKLNNFLEGKGTVYYDVEQDAYDNCCSYPDVTLQCHMKKRVDEALKNEIFGIVEDYISLWNSNPENLDQIHYASLEENVEVNHIVSVFIDFGNCDPIALVNLLEYLLQSNSKIKRITFV